MLRLTVGIARKVGRPNYSSDGAECQLTLELPGDLIDHPDQLSPRIQRAYAIAAQAVAAELTRQAGDVAGVNHQVTAAVVAEPPPPQARTNGHQVVAQAPATRRTLPYASNPSTKGRGGRDAPASEKQIRCLYARAKSAGVDMDELLQANGVNTAEELTIRACSDMIDQLSAARN